MARLNLAIAARGGFSPERRWIVLPYVRELPNDSALLDAVDKQSARLEIDHRQASLEDVLRD
jgi:hypothetical protein